MRMLAIAEGQQKRLTLLAPLQADDHIGVDEIDLIVLEGLPSISADISAGIDNHLTDIEPPSIIDQALGPDNHGNEMSPRRCGADEIQRLCRYFLESLKGCSDHAQADGGGWP
jgi:hypothetical protein